DESVSDTLPVVSTVGRAVEPTAGRHPHVVGVVAVDRDLEHVGVEDHAAVDQLPALAAVLGAVALAPRADVDAVARARVEGQRLDIDLLGDLLPRPATVGAAPDAVARAGDDAAGVVR